MTLDYTEDGVVKIDMRNYVNKILDELPARMDGAATTPASHHLFEVRNEAIPLGDAATVAKLLFLYKRG
jgi:hypothetical protein